MINLYDYQKQELLETSQFNKVAYFHDMGLGKTFTGAEKAMSFGQDILLICQKSKIRDWIDHFFTYYIDKMKCDESGAWCYDLTNKNGIDYFIHSKYKIRIGVINYDLVFRRPELKELSNFTLMLDESSLIQNEQAKRSKFILKLQPKNVILLSGTPTGGKYEKLWSQLHLLGWNISKKMYYDQYVDFHWDDSNGFPLMVIDGYKNENRLKRKMKEYGCRFLKTDEILDLPDQIHQTINVPISKEYKQFRKTHIIQVDDTELMGDTVLTQMLYERQLCGQYNSDKIKAFDDLLESTEDRLIVFYNFNAELSNLLEHVQKLTERDISIVNGQVKDLYAYEKKRDSVTFIQYQAGAMGLNLQKANKIIYFTPPLSSELFEQSKKRIHRIGQSKPCFYYYLTCKNSIEERIYSTLAMRKDYINKLFEKENCTKEELRF